MGKRRKSLKAPDEIVWRWMEGWRYHYEFKVPNATPPSILLEKSEELEKETEKG